MFPIEKLPSVRPDYRPEISRQQLIEWDAEGKKIRVIPLGVDISHFHPAAGSDKKDIRSQLGIPEDAFVIGSFHKDGEGWKEGLKPKMIKGPDILCDVLENVAEKHRIHVLLTGPARGYVKERLTRAGIDFTHRFLDNYLDIAPLYRALDLYLVTSRAEGGPKGILESMASGVPLVSTCMGMAPDVIRSGENGQLADVEDVDALAAFVQEIIDSPKRGEMLATAAAADATAYDWRRIAERYYRELYEPLM